MNWLTFIFVGITAGGSFGSLYAGPTVQVEVPIRYVELDARDTFAPLESHISLGHGYGNDLTIEPSLWLKRNVGLDVRFDYTQYHVTRVSKRAEYVYGGVALHPTQYMRLNLDYFREVNNGVSHGIQTSHLQGGSLYLKTQISCSSKICYYTTLETAVGTLLEQGNPAYAYRKRATSGSGIFGFLVRMR